MKYRLSRLAARDLGGIDDYTAEHFGERQARFYGALIIAALDRLASEPLLPSSRPREDLGLGLRSLHVGALGRRRHAARHIIFYRLEPAGIGVARILHEAMDPTLAEGLGDEGAAPAGRSGRRSGSALAGTMRGQAGMRLRAVVLDRDRLDGLGNPGPSSARARSARVLAGLLPGLIELRAAAWHGERRRDGDQLASRSLPGHDCQRTLSVPCDGTHRGTGRRQPMSLAIRRFSTYEFPERIAWGLVAGGCRVAASYAGLGSA